MPIGGSNPDGKPWPAIGGVASSGGNGPKPTQVDKPKGGTK
jgi:hypothetical protein